MLKRLFALIILFNCVVLLSACQADIYASREECLSTVITRCKQYGWHYMMTNPVCKQAAAGGIYSLTAAQLEQCRPTDKHGAHQPQDHHQSTINEVSLYQQRNFNQSGAVNKPDTFQYRNFHHRNVNTQSLYQQRNFNQHCIVNKSSLYQQRSFNQND